jgi:hypothetical protein
MQRTGVDLELRRRTRPSSLPTPAHPSIPAPGGCGPGRRLRGQAREGGGLRGPRACPMKGAPLLLRIKRKRSWTAKSRE